VVDRALRARFAILPRAERPAHLERFRPTHARRNLPWFHLPAVNSVPMDAPLPPLVPPAYKDRRTGLIVFGIFAIVIGAICALFVPLMIVGQVMTARKLAQKRTCPPRSSVPASMRSWPS